MIKIKTGNGLKPMYIKMVLIISFLISTAILAWLILHQINERNELVVETKTDARNKAVSAARAIENQIVGLLSAESLADRFTKHGDFSDYRAVETYLIEAAAEHRDVSSFTAAFLPHSVPDNTPPSDALKYQYPLYSPYTWWDGDELTIVRVDDSYDYTLPDPSSLSECDLDAVVIVEICNRPRTAWFTDPIDQNESVWGEPYFGDSGRTYWAGFGTPFYRSDGFTKAGMISADMKLADIQRMISELTPGNLGDGYGFIVSQDGLFISHPDTKFVQERKNISELDPDWAITKLNASIAESGKNLLTLDHTAHDSGQDSWVFLVPVKNAGWWIGISVDKGQIFKNAGFLASERYRLALIATLAIITASLAISLLLRVYTGNRTHIFISVAIICALFLSGIVYLWFINLGSDPSEGGGNIELVDGAITAKVVNNISTALRESGGAIDVSQTGIYVQSLDLSKSGRLSVAGYIWVQSSQNQNGQPITIPGGRDTQLDLLYSDNHKTGTVRTTSFSTNIQQDYDYKKYPFQREDINIRFRPTNLTENILLSPDLASYETTNPRLLPGLNQEIIVDGWHAVESFFAYKPVSFGTDFGDYDSLKKGKRYDLTYNITLKRSYISPLLTNFIPILVVALLLYAVLLTISRNPTVVSAFGFSTLTVLGFCGTLFFAVVVAHLNLRIGLGTQGVIYIESFYFALYGALVFVGMNALLVSSQAKLGVFQVGNNELMKILYWPTILVVLYGITFFTFS